MDQWNNVAEEFARGQWTEQTNLRPPKKGNYFTEIWIRRELLTGIYR